MGLHRSVGIGVMVVALIGVASISRSAPVESSVVTGTNGSGVVTVKVTAPVNAQLIALISGDGPNAVGAQTTTVSSSGLAWTLVKRANARPGVADVWTTRTTVAITNKSITGSLVASGFFARFTVAVVTGASGVGSSVSASGTSGAATGTLTALTAGSFAYGVGGDWSVVQARTVLSGQRKLAESTPGGLGTFWAQALNGVTGAGSLILGTSAPSSANWNFAAVEVLASGAPPPPCTFTVSPTALTAVDAGTSSPVTVTTNLSTCSWTASSGAAWLSVSPSSGMGSGSVTVTSAANTGAQRTGIVTIAGTTVTVTQDAAPAGPPTLTVTCPVNQTATSSDGQPTAVTWPPPTTTGGTPPITGPTATPTSGSLFAVGTTNVAVTVSSSDGQSASCGFTVTVTDGSSSGPTKYVRAGAPAGGSGNDWATAYTALPSMLTRGTTYYLADGTYAGRTFNTATSGTSVITIKKAILTDHGTSAGWLDTYGDGQAAFTDQLLFTTGYWLLDGQVGGGPSDTKAGWTTGYGIKVTETSSDPVIFVQGGSGNIVFRHIEAQGHGDGIDGGFGNDAFQVYYATGPVTLSYAYLHDAGRCIFYVGASSQSYPVTAEYVYTGNYEATGTEHSEMTVLHGNVKFIFRWSVVTHQEGTGMIVAGDDSRPGTAEIYGNIFIDTGEFPWQGNQNGLLATDSSGQASNWKVFNNTFIKVDANNSNSLFNAFGSVSGNVFQNNYLYLSDQNSPNGWGTLSSNHFQDSGSTQGTGATTGTGNPFVNYPAFDFHLLAPTAAGQTLGAPYNVDMFGRVRGADGVWDRGALEY